MSYCSFNLIGFRQIRELQVALSQPCFAIFHGVITIIASLGVSFYYCWSLTLVILASTPVSLLILNALSSSMQPYIVDQVKLMEQASKAAIGGISAIETVKLFNGQTVELQKYVTPLQAAAVYYHKQIRVNAMCTGFAGFVTYSVFVQGFWYGNHLVATRKVSAGTVVTTFFSALTAMQTISAVLPQLIFVQKGIAAGTALTSLIDSCKLEHNAVTAISPISCRGEIEFRHVGRHRCSLRLHILTLHRYHSPIPCVPTTIS
jgi:ATP-binding cassette subfamily B (MDR/TAP) protein 1